MIELLTREPHCLHPLLPCLGYVRDPIHQRSKHRSSPRLVHAENILSGLSGYWCVEGVGGSEGEMKVCRGSFVDRGVEISEGYARGGCRRLDGV